MDQFGSSNRMLDNKMKDFIKSAGAHIHNLILSIAINSNISSAKMFASQ